MSVDIERIEEELRSEIYAALVELGFAEKQDKLRVVSRLSVACGKLHALIADGPATGSVTAVPLQGRAMANPNEGLKCPIRQDLLHELVTVVDEIIDLGSREIAAVTTGESLREIDHIDRNMDQSMSVKSALLKQYMSHCRTHG